MANNLNPVTEKQDKPLNGGFVCARHHIGYIGACPSCASESYKHPYSKKQIKKQRQWLKKRKGAHHG